MDVAQKTRAVRNHPKTAFSLFATITFSAAISLGLALAILSQTSKLSISKLLSQIQGSYYFPYINSSRVGEVGFLSFHVLLYCVIAGTMLMVLIRKFFLKSEHPLRSIPFYRIGWYAGLFFFCFLLTIQSANFQKRFMKDVRTFRGKTIHEKYQIIHLAPYKIADFFKRDFPGRRRGRLVTDMDISREPFMWGHRVAAYHLYPTIDIRDINPEKPVDCLFVFQKKDPRESVPESFFIWKIYDDQNILAIKKGKLDGVH